MTIRPPIAAVPFLVVAALGQSIAPTDVDGWSKSKWGMTEKQVRDAFKEEAVGSESANNLTIPDYRIGRSRFKVAFVMDERTKLLNRVNIIPVDGGPGYDGPVVNTGPENIFDDLKTLLISKYGQPTSAGATRPGNSAAVWKFKSTTINLDISTLGGVGRFLTLNYRQNAPGDLDRI